MAEIEPRLLELAEVAKAAQKSRDEALSGFSVPVSIYMQVENPLHFKNSVAVLRQQPDRPLSERVYDSMAVLVTSIIAERDIQGELQEMLGNNRDAVVEAEGAVAEHILPEDMLLAPNISGFRKTAEDLEFIFGLNARGLELLPEPINLELFTTILDVLKLSPPEPEIKDVEDPVLTAERKRLLRRLVFRGGEFFLGGKRLHLSNTARIAELKCLHEHLNTVWTNDNLGVPKEVLDHIAEENGHSGTNGIRTPGPEDMSALNRDVFAKARYKEAPIHVESVHDPKNSRIIYYRLREGVPTVKVHRPVEDDLVGEKNNEVKTQNRPPISSQSRTVYS